MWVGAFAGTVLAVLVIIAFDTGYEAQTLAGGEHLRDRAILIIILISAGAGGFVGTVLGGSRSRPPRGS